MVSSIPALSSSTYALNGARNIHVIAQGYRNDYYGDEGGDYYDGEKGSTRRRGARGTQKRQSASIVNNPRQVGAALIAVGVLLTFMGMMLFFEGNLLRLGNICIISGIPFLVGVQRIRKFFLKPERMQATIITALGIFLVFMGRPRMGILCEVFGLLNLFGNMFPLLFAIGRRMPIIGDVLSAFDSGAASKKRYRPEM
jgi:hypothetical protein